MTIAMVSTRVTMDDGGRRDGFSPTKPGVTSRGDWGSASAHGYSAGDSSTSVISSSISSSYSSGLMEVGLSGYLASSASFASSSRCFCARLSLPSPGSRVAPTKKCVGLVLTSSFFRSYHSVSWLIRGGDSHGQNHHPELMPRWCAGCHETKWFELHKEKKRREFKTLPYRRMATAPRR